MSKIEQGGSIGLDWGNLRDMLAERLADEIKSNAAAAGSEPGAVQASPDLASSLHASENLMAGNFTRRNKTESRYVTATLNSFRQQSLQEISQKSSLTAQLDELSAWVSSDNPAMARKQIERALKRKRDQKIYAEAERAALAAKAELDRQATEASATKGAGGEPLLPETAASSAMGGAASVIPPSISTAAGTMLGGLAQSGMGGLAAPAQADASAGVQPADGDGQASIDILI